MAFKTVTQKEEPKSKEEVVHNAEVTPPVYTHTALGTCQDAKTQRWVLVEIKYNPETGDVGEVKKSLMDDGRIEVTERFKVKAVELLPHYKDM